MLTRSTWGLKLSDFTLLLRVWIIFKSTESDAFADADVIVFDLPKVKAPATKNNPKRLSEGIEQVIVNGEFVIKNKKHTGNLPGKSIRRGINS